MLPTAECLESDEVFQDAKSVGLLAGICIETSSELNWSSLIHTTFWEQHVEQRLHCGAEENCFRESYYKLDQNRWTELK